MRSLSQKLYERLHSVFHIFLYIGLVRAHKEAEASYVESVIVLCVTE